MFEVYIYGLIGMGITHYVLDEKQFSLGNLFLFFLILFIWPLFLGAAIFAACDNIEKIKQKLEQ